MITPSVGKLLADYDLRRVAVHEAVTTQSVADILPAAAPAAKN